ncbi:glycosyltransferase, group 4 family [Ostertagia ostertagi]
MAGALALSTVFIGLLGAVDDIRPLPVIPRLAAQTAALVFALGALGPEARLAPELPLAAERGLEVVAGLWFVNLTNFMDGLDWLTVAGVAPMLMAMVVLGACGVAGGADAAMLGLVAAALFGGLMGFAPFNRPPARLFLGDVGSLAIGLVTAWLLFLVAAGGALVAALILPMYYCADASITLCRRLLRKERIWEAHRCHFYQQAADRGVPPMRVAALIAGHNAALAALAALALLPGGLMMQLALLACAMGVTAVLLARLAGRL